MRLRQTSLAWLLYWCSYFIFNFFLLSSIFLPFTYLNKLVFIYIHYSGTLKGLILQLFITLSSTHAILKVESCRIFSVPILLFVPKQPTLLFCIDSSWSRTCWSLYICIGNQFAGSGMIGTIQVVLPSHYFEDNFHAELSSYAFPTYGSSLRTFFSLRDLARSCYSYSVS